MCVYVYLRIVFVLFDIVLLYYSVYKLSQVALVMPFTENICGSCSYGNRNRRKVCGGCGKRLTQGRPTRPTGTTRGRKGIEFNHSIELPTDWNHSHDMVNVDCVLLNLLLELARLYLN